MNKKRKILYLLLISCVVVFIVIILNIINNNKIVEYDDYTINKIAKYLNVNSLFYDGIVNDMSISYEVNTIDTEDIFINKQIASYVITNVTSNSEYNKDKCVKCYKYFSDDDDIRFYNVDDIDNIANELFGKNLKRINQDDKIDFNTIYYNEDINMYYINISFNSFQPNVASLFKNYSYDDDMLYIDYYYFKIEYNNDKDVDTEDDNNTITLYNIDDIMIKEISYNDLFNDNNVIENYEEYIPYFDIIRYEFKYDGNSKKFILNGIRRLEK